MTDEERTPHSMKHTKAGTEGLACRYADVALHIVAGAVQNNGRPGRRRSYSRTQAEAKLIEQIADQPQTQAFNRMVAECRAKLQAGVPEEELTGSYSVLVRKAAKG